MNQIHPGWKRIYEDFFQWAITFIVNIFIDRLYQKINELVNIKLLLFCSRMPQVLVWSVFSQRIWKDDLLIFVQVQNAKKKS